MGRSPKLENKSPTPKSPPVNHLPPFPATLRPHRVARPHRYPEDGMNNSVIPVLRHEDQTAFDRLLESYLSEFQPTTTHEHFLVDQLAQSRWRLDRAHRLEALALEQIVSGDSDETNPNSRILAHLGPNALTTLNRWAAAAEKSYYRAHRELTQARSRELRNKANDAQVWLQQQLAATPMPKLDPWILYGDQLPPPLTPPPYKTNPIRPPPQPRHPPSQAPLPPRTPPSASHVDGLKPSSGAPGFAVHPNGQHSERKAAGTIPPVSIESATLNSRATLICNILSA